ncbi:hypothetical protein A3848_12870 [Paenibacillus sp. P32E]|nr:hypothetical protein A3848_12870 [Paenibacillus sp. P32E]
MAGTELLTSDPWSGEHRGQPGIVFLTKDVILIDRSPLRDLFYYVEGLMEMRGQVQIFEQELMKRAGEIYYEP